MFSIMVVCNLTLFALMTEGHATLIMQNQCYAYLACVRGAMGTELASISTASGASEAAATDSNAGSLH